MQDRYEEEKFGLLFEAVNHNKREEFRELFLRLHERDQLNLFHLLYPDPENKTKISEFLSPEEFAEILNGWMLEIKKMQSNIYRKNILYQYLMTYQRIP